MGDKRSPGPLVHADGHGAAAVSRALIPAVARALDRLFATERLVPEAART